MIIVCKSDKCRSGHSQDKIHGAGKRVMNSMKAEDSYRCTVCSTVTVLDKKKADAPKSKAA